MRTVICIRSHKPQQRRETVAYLLDPLNIQAIRRIPKKWKLAQCCAAKREQLYEAESYVMGALVAGEW
jgi:hypothetical protein